MCATPRWLDSTVPLLADDAPVPIDRPFATSEVLGHGVSRRQLHMLVDRGLIRSVVHGVYAAAQLVDSMELRAQAISLVRPTGTVVTDRSAAWLHGVDVLPRSAAHEAPPLDVFSSAHSRLRRPGIRSGGRTMTETDVTEVHGIPVTTPLRTALDLGRSLPRYDAIAALDSFLRSGVDQDELLKSVERFKGDRGVVQLRELAPLADARAESPPESSLRLHGHDAGLALIPQVWVCDEAGTPVYRLDLALEALNLGFEFNGVRFHLDNEADAARLAWLRERGWHIVVFTAELLYGRGADPMAVMAREVMLARARLGRWRPQGIFLPHHP